MIPNPSSDPADAPYGVDALRGVPIAAFLAALLLGVGSLAAAVRWQGGQRGALLLAGIFLVDFGVAGCRTTGRRLLPGLRKRWLAVLCGALGLGAIAEGGRLGLLYRAKAAATASATVQGSARVREVSGVARSADLVLLPLEEKLAGAGGEPLEVLVYDGLRRLPAGILSDGAEKSLIVETRLRPRQALDLQLYFGVGWPSQDLDPEKGWDLQGAYRRAVASFSWKAETAAGPERVPPFFGTTSLRIAVEPLPGVASTFLWAPVPVPFPETVSPTTQLLYAIRYVGARDLAAGVHVRTSQGDSWDQSALDQEGLSMALDTDLAPRAAARWYLRRLPLGAMSGARIESVGIVILSGTEPAHSSEAEVFYFDAIRLVDGGPLEAEVSAFQGR